MDLICWLGLLHTIFTSFLSYFQACACFIINFCIISCYLLQRKPGLKYLHSCSYLDYVVQRLGLALSNWPNRIGVSLSPENGNRSSFRNVVFSSFKIPDDWQSPKTSNSNFNICYSTQRNLSSWCNCYIEWRSVINHLSIVIEKIQGCEADFMFFSRLLVDRSTC
jgi:hypothetical protein